MLSCQQEATLLQQPAPEPQPNVATPEVVFEPVERITEDQLSMAFWPLWVLPFACVGLAFLLAAYSPRSIQNFYFDTVIPFGITFWLGMFFSYGWELQRLWLQDLPRKWVPWILGAGIVFVFFLMGGPMTLVDDPWLAGMVIVPGVRMYMTYQRKRAVG